MSLVAPEYGDLQVMPKEGALAHNATFTPVRAEDNSLVLNRAIDKLQGHIDKYQAEQDEARITEALNDLKREQIIQQFGDKDLGRQGYASLLGKNAIEPDKDGLSMAQRTDKELKAYKDSLAAKLTPWQKKKFEERAGVIIEGNYRNATAHMSQQGQAYALDQQQGALLTAITGMASNPEDQLGNKVRLDDIKNAVEHMGAIQGSSKDVVDATIKEKQSEAVTKGIAHLLDMADADNSLGKAHQAAAFFHKYGRYLTAEASIKTRNAVQEVVDKFQIKAHVDALANFGKQSTIGMTVSALNGANEGVVASSVKDMSAILASATRTTAGARNVGVGQNVRDENGHMGAYGVPKEVLVEGAIRGKLISGVVTIKQWEKLSEEDKAQKTAELLNLVGKHQNLQQRVAEGVYAHYIEKYEGDQARAIVAYNFGEAIADKMKEGDLSSLSTEQMRKLQNIQSVLDMAGSIKDSNGKKVLPSMGAEYAQAKVRSQQMSAWEALEVASQRDQRLLTDPDYRNKFIASFEGEQRLRQAQLVKEEKDRQAQVSAYVYQSKGDLHSIPPALWTELTPAEQHHWRETASNLQESTEIRATLDPTEYARLMTLPDAEMAKYTAEDIKGMVARFSKADADRIVQHWAMAVNKTGANLDKAQSLQNANAVNTELFVTPSADTIPSSTLENGIKLVFENDKDYGAYKSDTSGNNRAMYDAVKLVLEKGIVSGQLPPKPTDNQIASYLKLNTQISAMSSAYGTYGSSKPLYKVKFKDLPNRNSTDGQAVVDQIARGIRATKGLNPEDVTDRDRELAWKTLALSPQSIPMDALSQVSLGENQEADTRELMVRRLKAKGKSEAVIQKVLAEWDGLPLQLRVREYVIASMHSAAVQKAASMLDQINANYDPEYAETDDIYDVYESN